jgi:prepilin-type N-terminal cleavage/methylation domain-containing protein
LLTKKKGFTLVEIIAVLLILSILAVLAVPKYFSMAEEARTRSAQGAIAEISSRLASSQAKYMLNNSGVAPASPELFTYATGASGYGSAANLANVGSDFNVTVATGTPITITVSDVGNVALLVPVAGSFTAAGD